LILLTGAPAAGKATATSLVSEVTGINRSIVMSDLLKTSMARAVDLNSSAALAPDTDACRLFRQAVSSSPKLDKSGKPFSGYMVDGFPRSEVQVCTV
jgi:adenylate kinase family enzyme